MLKSDIREKLSYEKLMNLFGAAYFDFQNHYVSLSKDADIDAVPRKCYSRDTAAVEDIIPDIIHKHNVCTFCDGILK